MSSSTRLIVSILLVAVLGIAFWMLALGPKHEEADELAAQVGQLQVTLSEAQGKATEAAAARRKFPDDYEQLVVLGQAVPAGDETASLLVELSQVAASTKVKFQSIQLNGTGEAAAAPEAVAPAATVPAAGASSSAVPASATIPPTEAAASMMPLGASIGPAGLAKMPYSLTFTGGFFQFADFIEKIDSLVDTGDGHLGVDGRLVTLDGFALNGTPEGGFKKLNATFAVTTYLVPPSQGVTAGASPTAPAPAVATPAASTEAPAAEATPVSEAR